MNRSFIRVLGQFDKVLKENENGTAVVLFKIEPRMKTLNSSIVMSEISKKQWNKIKVLQEKDKSIFSIYGEYEIRLKNSKPFIYIKCDNAEKVKSKNVKKTTEKLEELLQEKEPKLVKKPIKEKKIKIKKDKNNWYELIPIEEFIEIDINKVKLVEEIHLSSRISIFDIKKMSKYDEINPIAVRKLENGEYGLITGVRSFIVGKLFSRNLKAYVTDLDRETFKERYSLEK